MFMGAALHDKMRTVTMLVLPLLCSLLCLTHAGDVVELSGTADVRTAALSWQCPAPACDASDFSVQYYPVNEPRLATSFKTRATNVKIGKLLPKTKYVFVVYSADANAHGTKLFLETSPVTVSDLECNPTFMRVFVHTGEAFTGIIYVDTHYDECVVRGPAPTGDSQFVVDIDITRCAYDKGNFTWEAVLIAQEDARITTVEDTALLITCEYSPSEKKVLSAILELSPSAPDGSLVDEESHPNVIQPNQRIDAPLDAELRSDVVRGEPQGNIEQRKVQPITFTTTDYLIVASVGLFILLAATSAILWYRWRLRRIKETEKLAAVNEYFRHGSRSHARRDVYVINTDRQTDTVA